EQHIGLRLERHQIAGRHQAPARVVVPVTILLVERLLLVMKRRDLRAQVIGRLADHRERPCPRRRLPAPRRYPKRTERDDVHRGALPPRALSLSSAWLRVYLVE